MKKFKMWYIKLAFGALFFALIAQIPYLNSLQKNAKAEENTAPEVTFTQQTGVDEAELTKAISVKKSVTQNSKYPYKLVIPKINISAGVVGLGLTEDGRMAVPNNFTEVGWYNLGTNPGEVGSVVMGAHVDNGGSTPGVFKNLKNLTAGDQIYIYDTQGKEFRYVVTDKKVYNRSSSSVDIFSKSDEARLNLITCYGTWLPKEKTYDSRLVIFAELI